jgi:hypothetical protein
LQGTQDIRTAQPPVSLKNSKFIFRSIYIFLFSIDANGDVQLKEYPLTAAGVIESWIERKP